MKPFSVLANERIASIRDIQRNPSKALRGITRVTKGSETIGFFLANEDFADLVESHEAMSSKAFVQKISKARREMKGGKGKSLDSLLDAYGI
jgi:hypothetical protein